MLMQVKIVGKLNFARAKAKLQSEMKHLLRGVLKEHPELAVAFDQNLVEIGLQIPSEERSEEVIIFEGNRLKNLDSFMGKARKFYDDVSLSASFDQNGAEVEKDAAVLSISIEDFVDGKGGYTVLRSLQEAGIVTVGDLIKKSVSQLLELPHYRVTTIRWMKEKLADLGLELREDGETTPAKDWEKFKAQMPEYFRLRAENTLNGDRIYSLEDLQKRSGDELLKVNHIGLQFLNAIKESLKSFDPPRYLRGDA